MGRSTTKANEEPTPNMASPVADAPAKPKRKQLTAAEKVAKLEADLAAAREKAQGADRKRQEKLQADRKKHDDKRVELVSKISAIDAELEVIEARLNPPAEG